MLLSVLLLVHFVGGKSINLIPHAIYVMCEESLGQLQIANFLIK
jgi:hypothetical protein